MNVLSLFDGMSCGQIALKELSIPVEKYYASEIDKYAIAQSTLNFPGTIHLGSVVNVDVSQLDRIDLLIGGSPCQSFSFAGKRKGMATKTEIEITKLSQYMELKDQGFEFEGQSYLFWEYMRILTEIRKYNPNVKFLLENVEMGAKWERVLSEAIGIFGVHINSNLVSAQNRARIYWTNIRVKEVGLFGELHSDIPQPKDRGILLKDILEPEVDEKYYLSDKMLAGLQSHSDRKQAEGCGFKFSPKNGTVKGNALTARCFKMGVDDNYITVIGCDFRTDEGFRFRDNGKTGTLQARARNDESCGQLVMTKEVIQLNPSLESGGKQPYQHNRVYDIDGISPTLNTDARSPGILTQSRIRRLTPTECARLQTIPDWYVWTGTSDTQIYKMCGNGWTVEVIKHILSFLNSF